MAGRGRAAAGDDAGRPAAPVARPRGGSPGPAAVGPGRRPGAARDGPGAGADDRTSDARPRAPLPVVAGHVAAIAALRTRRVQGPAVPAHPTVHVVLVGRRAPRGGWRPSRPSSTRAGPPAISRWYRSDPRAAGTIRTHANAPVERPAPRLLSLRRPMATIPQSRLRNFSIIAHIDHGKSTLADRLLELTHTIDARQMTSQVLDSMDLEREKGITIKARAVRLEYAAKRRPDLRLNLIDTPGHVDFSYEVSRSLQACEGAILVVDAAQGIEAQTLANVHLALAQDLVIVPVINKIDLPMRPARGGDGGAGGRARPSRARRSSSSPPRRAPTSTRCWRRSSSGCRRPRATRDAPLQGLIFDSHYDTYKGVVAYVRARRRRRSTRATPSS